VKAFVFPGQGAQFPGMGKSLYEGNPEAKALFEEANEILGFRITDIMFEGSEEELKQTKVTQPAIFLHSVILAKTTPDFAPEMVAGHSLGEFSALVANGTLAFEDGLRLVYQRAMAMQEACEINPSTMAAILGLADEKVEEMLSDVSSDPNYYISEYGLDYKDFVDQDDFIQAVVDEDGYGVVNPYDGGYTEITIKDELFYVMRIE
jgi:[acyl-carrier-protein] S-malonyltransferase